MTLQEPVQRFYTSQSLRLGYLEWGSPDAPPLLLVHGEADHCHSWDWVASAFADDWRILVPDLRGHGDSEWVSDGNYPMYAYIFDIAELIGQTCSTPVSIIGHSMGGNVVTRYAATYPEMVANLVVIEGIGRTPQLARQQDALPATERLAAWISAHRSAAVPRGRSFHTISDAAIRMRSIHPFLSEAQALHLAQHGTRMSKDGLYRWKFDRRARTMSPVDYHFPQLQELWARITARVLLIYGSKSTDGWAADPQADGRIACFRNATRIIFQHAGHWVQHDCTDAFIDCVRDFLD